jgi:hypothetical protein
MELIFCLCWLAAHTPSRHPEDQRVLPVECRAAQAAIFHQDKPGPHACGACLVQFAASQLTHPERTKELRPC